MNNPFKTNPSKAEHINLQEESRKRFLFRCFRLLTFPIFTFALLLVTDDWLPYRYEIETGVKGWVKHREVSFRTGRSSSQYIAYMQT